MFRGTTFRREPLHSLRLPCRLSPCPDCCRPRFSRRQEPAEKPPRPQSLSSSCPPDPRIAGSAGALRQRLISLSSQTFRRFRTVWPRRRSEPIRPVGRFRSACPRKGDLLSFGLCSSREPALAGKDQKLAMKLRIGEKRVKQIKEPDGSANPHWRSGANPSLATDCTRLYPGTCRASHRLTTILPVAAI